MTTTPPTDHGPQDDEPPDIRLIVRAGITVLGRIVRNERLDVDDLLRLAAYRRALMRLRDHLDGAP